MARVYEERPRFRSFGSITASSYSAYSLGPDEEEFWRHVSTLDIGRLVYQRCPPPGVVSYQLEQRPVIEPLPPSFWQSGSLDLITPTRTETIVKLSFRDGFAATYCVETERVLEASYRLSASNAYGRYR